jgi:hypothetical protein
MGEFAGKVGPHRESHEPRLNAMNFTTGLTPVSGYLPWNGTIGVGEKWNMDGNDKFGCCGPAATDHNNIAKERNPHLAGQLGRPKFAGVLGCYFAYGIDQGEPGPEPDQGVDNATWLGWLYTQGIIYGYGEVPLAYLDWFAQTARGAICGLIINGNQAIDDFNQSPKAPWGAMPGAQDGHDTLLIQTNPDGSGGLVTWGAVQPFDHDFRVQITDAWIIYDADDPQVDHSALQAALADVHGPDIPQAVESPHSGFWKRVKEDIEHDLKEIA